MCGVQEWGGGSFTVDFKIFGVVINLIKMSSVHVYPGDCNMILRSAAEVM
jgi:hypothetical protein